MITADGTVVTLVSSDCCPYLDDHEPNYVNPAVAAPQEVGHSVTWDPDIVPPEISATAGSYFSKSKVVTSATVGSNPDEGYGDSSATAGSPYGDTSATAGCTDLEDDYEDMPELHYSESEDVVPEDDSEDEEGTGFWGSLKPALAARVVNPIPC